MNVCLPRFGSRTLVMTGGLCMALSAILSSLANELTLVIMIYSVFFCKYTCMASRGCVVEEVEVVF